MYVYDFSIKVGSGVDGDPERVVNVDIAARNWKEACSKLAPSMNVVAMKRRPVKILRGSDHAN